MIKCNIEKGKKIKIKAAGPLNEINTDICTLIKMTYSTINQECPEAATEFKNQLIGVLLDPDSPVWDGKSGAIC